MATSAPHDPCAFASLSSYDWALYSLLKKQRGLCHGVSFVFNPTVWCLTIVFHTLTIWLALGVNVQLFLTFKRWTTLYFWSIFVTTWAIIICTLCFDLRNFTRVGNGDALQWAQAAMWILESMGFSFVLYSRLYLVTDCRYLKLVPFVILCLDLTVHTVVLVGKAGLLSPEGWAIVIRFVPIFFSTQETILSTLYVYLFIRFMRQSSHDPKTKSMFRFLINAELTVIVFDVMMVTFNFLHFEVLKTVLTPFFYSVKLKVEFMVLNRLLGFRQNTPLHLSSGASGAAAVNRPHPLGMESENSSSSDESLSGREFRHREADSITAVSMPTGDMAKSESKNSIERLERQYLGQFGKEIV